MLPHCCSPQVGSESYTAFPRNIVAVDNAVRSCLAFRRL
jgi:hypothetical protein